MMPWWWEMDQATLMGFLLRSRKLEVLTCKMYVLDRDTYTEEITEALSDFLATE